MLHDYSSGAYLFVRRSDIVKESGHSGHVMGFSRTVKDLSTRSLMGSIPLAAGKDSHGGGSSRGSGGSLGSSAVPAGGGAYMKMGTGTRGLAERASPHFQWSLFRAWGGV